RRPSVPNKIGFRSTRREAPMRRVLLAILGTSALALSASAQTPPAPTPGAAPKPAEALFSGMGAHRHPIRTPSAEAQKYFDQGVVLLFGFNHDEAYRSFSRAAELDPKSPMPHWGMALVLGANYNDPEPEAERLKKARAEVERALALSTGA